MRPRARHVVADAQSEPRIELPDAEYQRLMELLDDSPRPAGYVLGEGLRRRARDITRGREPNLRGPRNMVLVWTSAWGTDPKMLIPRYGHATPADTYLALGTRAYFRAFGDDRLLVWRQVLKPAKEATLRMSVFDTRQLSPVARRWYAWWRYQGQDQIIWKSGLLAEVDIPLQSPTGVYPLTFRREFRNVDEVLMLALQFERGRLPTRPVLFAARPQEDEVQVVTLDWWERKHSWRFIARVVRDPVSRNLVADGLGVKPFLLTPEGEFLGSLGVAKGRGKPARRVRATT
jgi:hypothetical protein